MIGGVALGLAYAASPVTCWFLVVMAGVFAWAGRGLSPGERRWVFGLLTVAVALRLLVVAALFLESDPHRMAAFFWEADARNLKLRAIWMRNIWMEYPVSPLFFNAAASPVYGLTAFIYPLAYVQYLLGPSPYGVHLVNVGLFVATVVMLYRLARSSFGPEAAAAGLTVLLFLPTLFAWSVSALKEPPFAFLAAAALVAGVTVVRAGPLSSRLLALGVVAGSMAVIDGVRFGGTIIAGAGLALGLAARMLARWTVLLVLVPVLLAAAGVHVASDPAIQARILSEFKQLAGLHMGHVMTEGHHYKLLDRRFYDATTGAALQSMTGAEAGRFAVRAMISVVFFPLPWQVASWEERAFLAQQILWYVLVGLAIVGFVAGLRRDVLVTCTLMGAALAGAAGVAMTSGNFGTMARHRDAVLPFVVWLSAVGGVVTLSRLTSRRRRHGGPETLPCETRGMNAGAAHALHGR